MEFADYLALLRRRWWLVALALVVCIAGSVVSTVTATKQYRTSARLLVSASSSESAIDEITKRQLSSQRAVAYAQYASTRPAVDAAVQAAGVTTTPSVTASADSSSPFLTITATSTDAAAAAAVANAYVQVLPEVVTRLDQAPAGTTLPQLSVLEPAATPRSPFTPRPVRNLLVGLVLGLVLGLAAALLRETLDTTIRRSSDLERVSEASLLGVVPREYGEDRLIAVTRPRSRRTEAYRQIRTALEFSGPAGMPRSIVVTSAAPGEGKSTLAANLAFIASLAGKDVVLVDADLRRPVLADVMGVAATPGLSDVLTGSVDLEDALQPIPGERVTVLASGTLPRSPSELLGAPAMRELITALEQRFDLVVIDTAPVLPVTDALVVGVNTGGVVVVARLAQTRRTALRRTVDAVHGVRAPLLGVVANGAIEEDDKGYGYGYGYLKKDRAQAEDLVPAEHIRAAPLPTVPEPAVQADVPREPAPVEAPRATAPAPVEVAREPAPAPVEVAREHAPQALNGHGPAGGGPVPAGGLSGLLKTSFGVGRGRRGSR